MARPCILATCALHQRKGVSDLIEACGDLLAEFPKWRLAIAREGLDRAGLEQQAGDLGPADRVTFLGFMRVPKTLVAQADVFVIASYADSGSLSIGEACAAKYAIVATAVGSTTEMLDFGAVGRLVSPGSPKQLAFQLSQLMLDPAERHALRKAACTGAEIFTKGRLAGDCDRIYRTVRSRPGARTATAES